MIAKLQNIRMKNIQADTDMRQSIAQPETTLGNTEIK